MLRDFGRRLRAARITGGWEEAQDFSRSLGLQKARYGRYERGEAMPPIDVLEDICKSLGLSLDWLILGRKRAAATE